VKEKKAFYEIRNRRIIALRFSHGGVTLDLCAKKFKLNRERTRQIINDYYQKRANGQIEINALEGEYWQRMAYYETDDYPQYGFPRS